MGSPEGWRWVWMVASALFLVGEVLTPGTFFLVSFAAGAALACLLAFLGVGVTWTWVGFLGGTLAAFAALLPLRHRLEGRAPPLLGVGADRLVGQRAVVLRAVTAQAPGLVRVDREEWRADSADGSAIDEGAAVVVLDVRGTRLVVRPAERESTFRPWELP